MFHDSRRRTHGALLWFTQGTDVKREVHVEWSVLDGHTEEEYYYGVSLLVSMPSLMHEGRVYDENQLFLMSIAARY